MTLEEIFSSVPAGCTFLVCNHERVPEVTALLYRRVDLNSGVVEQYSGKGETVAQALTAAIAEVPR